SVLNAIRANQDDKLVLIPGDSWSSANRWVTVHGPAGWIEDPANNFVYEAHQYFDSDESGTYRLSYDAELARNSDLANVGKTRVGGGYLTALSAASLSVARAVPGSLVTVYGAGFTDQTAQQQGAPYPLGLADVTVQVTDASGASAAAGLLYASDAQINLQMP